MDGEKEMAPNVQDCISLTSYGAQVNTHTRMNNFSEEN